MCSVSQDSATINIDDDSDRPVQEQVREILPGTSLSARLLLVSFGTILSLIIAMVGGIVVSIIVAVGLSVLLLLFLIRPQTFCIPKGLAKTFVHSDPARRRGRFWSGLLDAFRNNVWVVGNDPAAAHKYRTLPRGAQQVQRQPEIPALEKAKIDKSFIFRENYFEVFAGPQLPTWLILGSVLLSYIIVGCKFALTYAKDTFNPCTDGLFNYAREDKWGYAGLNGTCVAAADPYNFELEDAQNCKQRTLNFFTGCDFEAMYYRTSNNPFIVMVITWFLIAIALSPFPSARSMYAQENRLKDMKARSKKYMADVKTTLDGKYDTSIHNTFAMRQKVLEHSMFFALKEY